MLPDTIFQICSTIAMIGWLLLIIASPFVRGIDKLLIGVVITLFCIVYAWLDRSIIRSIRYEKLWQPGWSHDLISKQNPRDCRLGALPGFRPHDRYMDKKEFRKIRDQPLDNHSLFVIHFYAGACWFVVIPADQNDKGQTIFAENF